MTSSLSTQLLEHIKRGTVPDEWRLYIERLAAERQQLEHLLATSARIYGTTHLVGHLDVYEIPQDHRHDFQTHLIDNHACGGPPFLDHFQCQSIAYAKAQQIVNGGTGVSPQLFTHLLHQISDGIRDYQIPKHCSYSSGDVILGAHFAKHLLAAPMRNGERYILKPKEGLSLMTGSYVHIGLCQALVPSLYQYWNRLRQRVATVATSIGMDCQYIVDCITAQSNDPLQLTTQPSHSHASSDREVQLPVAIRGLPYVQSTLATGIHFYMNAISIALTRRSDNPLMRQGDSGLQPVSQASFFAPELALASSTLADAFQLCAWHSERRVHFLLSGECPGFRSDGRQSRNDMGLVQFSKRLTAQSRRAQSICSERPFSLNVATSHGVEDMATDGVNAALRLADTLIELHELLSIEEVVTEVASIQPDTQSGRQVTGAELQKRVEQKDKEVQRNIVLEHITAEYPFSVPS